MNGALYARYLGNHMTPVRVEKTTSGNTIIDARMLHPAPANDEVLLSILGRGLADEYNRPTIANHTVVVPARFLRAFARGRPYAVAAAGAVGRVACSTISSGTLFATSRKCSMNAT